MPFSHPKQITHRDISKYEEGGWKMDVCLGLLLVIVKYSQRYFWSAVALSSYAPADTQEWIFQQRSDLACHSERAAPAFQVRRFTWLLGFEVKIKK